MVSFWDLNNNSRRRRNEKTRLLRPISRPVSLCDGVRLLLDCIAAATGGQGVIDVPDGGVGLISYEAEYLVIKGVEVKNSAGEYMADAMRFWCRNQVCTGVEIEDFEIDAHGQTTGLPTMGIHMYGQWQQVRIHDATIAGDGKDCYNALTISTNQYRR